jgi:hypothetical protein
MVRHGGGAAAALHPALRGNDGDVHAGGGGLGNAPTAPNDSTGSGPDASQ